MKYSQVNDHKNKAMQKPIEPNQSLEKNQNNDFN